MNAMGGEKVMHELEEEVANLYDDDFFTFVLRHSFPAVV